MTNAYPYTLRAPIGANGKIGLIVLKADETIEHDVRRIFPFEDYAIYTSRILSEDELTSASLQRLKDRIKGSVELFPSAAKFDSIGFACTSAASTLGSRVIANEIRKVTACAHVSDPILALQKACDILNVSRIGILTPYDETITQNMRDVLAGLGIETPHSIGFNETMEANVARIDEASIKRAAIELGYKTDVDAVFISCTNLRTLDVIDEIEAIIGKPVLSSNQVLLWHLSQGLPKPIFHDQFGKLFSLKPNFQEQS